MLLQVPCVSIRKDVLVPPALVELNVDSVLKNEFSMSIPNEDDCGYTTEIIKVEY